MAKTNETSAVQTFKTERQCKHVVRFMPDGKATVGDKTVPELTSSIYVDNGVLAALGNPEKIIVTVTAAK